MQTVKDVLNRIGGHADTHRLPGPDYRRPADDASRPRVGLAVESMRRHMTDEGWQIFAGLWHNGWHLCGHGLPDAETNVRRIIERMSPGVVLLQDKREWDLAPGDFRETAAYFHEVHALAERPDVFKLTILKDAQSRPAWHARSAEEIGCHAWIVYYHPDVVRALNPALRPEHVIRTYHSVDADVVPAYTANRAGCLLSGAVSRAYPLRWRLWLAADQLPETQTLGHPGYHRNGSATPDFLRRLAQFKVAICTASLYGYALRKLIEATACGCVVVTDLPSDEVLPEIDGNLVRVHPDQPTSEVADVIRAALASYDPERQACYARAARAWYDYRAVTSRLDADIESMRARYVPA